MKTRFSELSTIILSFLLVKSNADKDNLDADPNGYIVYCPCMGKLKKLLIDFRLIKFIKINRSLR